MDLNAIKNLIEENALALTTINLEGKPHNIAVEFVKVRSSNQLLISDNYLVETIANIKKNTNVALPVWNADWKDKCISYGLKGTAEYFTSGKWLEAIKKISENKDALCKVRSLQQLIN